MSERMDDLESLIGGVEPPRAREPFRASLRASLLVAARRELAPARPAPRWWMSFTFAPRAAMAAVVVLAVLVGASGAAAASSLPGDVMYPVKLGLEQVELALAFDDSGRLAVLERQAERRLGEITTVAVSDPASVPTATKQYQETVDKFRAAIDALVSAPAGTERDAALDVAEAAATKHVAVLEALKEKHDTPGIDRALEEAQDLEQRAGPGRRHDDHDVAPNATPTETPDATRTPKATPRPTEKRDRETESPRPTRTPEVDD